MSGARALGLGGALLLLIALDVVIARVNVFGLLLPPTQPTGFFTSVNYQLTAAVSALYGGPAAPRPVLFVGNSQLDTLIHPLRKMNAALIAAGAPAGTRTISMCVFGTAPTDDEVLTRDLSAVHPGVVVFGISGPDVGTTLERARDMPVTANLDVGWRDGLVPPIDLDARLDRWVRTVWRLYRYRRLLRDLVVPSDEPRTEPDLSEERTMAEVFASAMGAEPARKALALRPGFERAGSFADALPYLEALRGVEYVPGLRERWRTLRPQPLQIEALRRAASHVRDAGGRPVWVLLPENPLLELDPEVGSSVRQRSDEVTARLRAAASADAVPLVDLRRLLPPSGFSDLNHAFPLSPAEVMEPLAAALATRGLLAEKS